MERIAAGHYGAMDCPFISMVNILLILLMKCKTNIFDSWIIRDELPGLV